MRTASCAALGLQIKQMGQYFKIKEDEDKYIWQVRLNYVWPASCTQQLYNYQPWSQAELAVSLMKQDSKDRSLCPLIAFAVFRIASGTTFACSGSRLTVAHDFDYCAHPQHRTRLLLFQDDVAPIHCNPAPTPPNYVMQNIMLAALVYSILSFLTLVEIPTPATPALGLLQCHKPCVVCVASTMQVL